LASPGGFEPPLPP